MKTHSLLQSSPAWHAFRLEHFGASEAPIMMGVSPYKTRSQLLHEKHTGITPDVDDGTQIRFNDGHRFEALARPLAEDIIGETLSPTVGENGKYSASFDGITFDSDIVWEHKTINDSLRGISLNGILPEHYRIQMEHQLMVSGAGKGLFTATKFDADDKIIEEEHCWYIPDLKLRDRIIAGWAQFEKDLATFAPQEYIPAPKAEVTIDLPALFVHAKGEITEHNMEAFGIALTAKLTEVRAIALVTDQDFSNAKEAAKKFRETAKEITLSEAAMLAQTETIGEASRKMKAWVKDLNATALQLEKDVEREDLAKKRTMVSETALAYSAHVEALEAETRPIQLNIPRPNFAEAIKGKRNYASMQSALNDALAAGKIEADAVAKDIRVKTGWMAGVSVERGEHKFLFADLQQIITKPLDDFKLLVNSRIDQHKLAEAAKLVRIQEEANARAKAAQDAILAAERTKMEAEVRARAEEEARARGKAEFEASDANRIRVNAEQEAAAVEERRRLAQIAAQTKPFPVHDKSTGHADTVMAMRRKESFCPTSEQIVEAVARAFETDNGTALTWLQTTDFESREAA